MMYEKVSLSELPPAGPNDYDDVFMDDGVVVAQLERAAEGEPITVPRRDLDINALGTIVLLQDSVKCLRDQLKAIDERRRTRRALRRTEKDTHSDSATAGFVAYASDLLRLEDPRPEPNK